MCESSELFIVEKFLISDQVLHQELYTRGSQLSALPHVRDVFYRFTNRQESFYGLTLPCHPSTRGKERKARPTLHDHADPTSAPLPPLSLSPFDTRFVRKVMTEYGSSDAKLEFLKSSIDGQVSLDSVGNSLGEFDLLM